MASSVHCIVPDNIQTHAIEGHSKFRGREGGISKVKYFKRKYKAKMEFPKVW